MYLRDALRILIPFKQELQSAAERDDSGATVLRVFGPGTEWVTNNLTKILARKGKVGENAIANRRTTDRRGTLKERNVRTYERVRSISSRICVEEIVETIYHLRASSWRRECKILAITRFSVYRSRTVLYVTKPRNNI